MIHSVISSSLDIGFTGSQLDPSLFTYHANHVHICLLVYVDDIILTGNHKDTISWILSKLKSEFALKDLGALSYFLGIQAIRDPNGLHLRQSKYINDLLDRTQITDAKPYPAPFVAGTKMSKFDGEPLTNPTTYRHIVGALQYVTLTRPDIAYSVNQLCQHMHAPTSTHFTAAKRVLRYLKGFTTKKAPSRSLPIVTRIGQGIRMTGGLPPALVCFLVLISFPGLLRNNTLFLDRAPKPSIEHYHWQLQKCTGCVCC
jgi:hypothetical protein